MKVVLIGDSIRMGYQELVAQKLDGVAEVWGPKENCSHSIWILQHFQQWIIDPNPDILHINCGIHDALPAGKPQVIIEQYRLNLERIVEQVKRLLPDATLIWAMTTPVYPPVEGAPMSEWPPHKEIDRYNAVAREIMEGAGIPINDLHEVIMKNDYAKCLSEDGCHMTEFGNEVLSDAVVRAVQEQAGS